MHFSETVSKVNASNLWNFDRIFYDAPMEYERIKVSDDDDDEF